MVSNWTIIDTYRHAILSSPCAWPLICGVRVFNILQVVDNLNKLHIPGSISLLSPALIPWFLDTLLLVVFDYRSYHAIFLPKYLLSDTHVTDKICHPPYPMLRPNHLNPARHQYASWYNNTLWIQDWGEDVWLPP